VKALGTCDEHTARHAALDIDFARRLERRREHVGTRDAATAAMLCRRVDAVLVAEVLVVVVVAVVVCVVARLCVTALSVVVTTTDDGERAEREHSHQSLSAR
jgi:hypothetical protein